MKILSAEWAKFRAPNTAFVAATLVALLGARPSVAQPVQPLADDFPMGFVHGSPARVAPLGFTLQQGYSSAQGQFVNGIALDVPNVDEGDSYSLRLGMRNLSMARPAEGLGSLLRPAAAKGQFSLTTAAYGEIAIAVGADGKPRSNGFNVCNIFDPNTRRYLLDYARAHVEARLKNPTLNQAIVLWGLDNEWEGQLDFSPQARAAFAPWLNKNYNGNIAQLNAVWKTQFPSFTAATQDKLPDSTDYQANPPQFLDWMNFQSEAFVTLLAEMARVMHETDPLRRGVIHKTTQQSIEMPVVNRKRTFDQELFATLVRPYSGGFIGIDAYGNGDREMYEVSYLANSFRTGNTDDAGVFLAETNNHSGPGHQFASTFWRALANGVKGINFFTLGFTGAKGDWDHFGFTDPKTGALKDKLFYAARWASLIKRNEKFWAHSYSAPNANRVALLMPRRDVLLADKDPDGSQWTYPQNNRSMVYRWLREQGYWVDVIPYSKLNQSELASYKALFLVGAEHLTAQESQNIAGYVSNGGVLVADARAGYWNQRHQTVNNLGALLGVKFDEKKPATPTKVTFDGANFLAQGTVSVIHDDAQLLPGSGSETPVYLNKRGKGKVLYLPFELGSLSTNRAATTTAALTPDGPTADSGERKVVAQEFLIGKWLHTMLQHTDLPISYRVSGLAPETAATLRVEQPLVDGNGNCVIVVTNRAQTAQEIVAPSIVELTLPVQNTTNALWADAESNQLQPIKTEKVGMLTRLYLPEIRTAGVLYLFENNTPLLGITPIAATKHAADGATPQVTPGQTLRFAAQIFNPSALTLPAGELHLDVPQGWKATTTTHATTPLRTGENKDYQFEVAVPSNIAALKPNWIYPLKVRWNDRTAISTQVEVIAGTQDFPHVLSDNTSYPTTYPYRTSTGATYRYLDAAKVRDPANSSTATGNSLQNGFGQGRIGQRYSSLNNSGNYARFDTTHANIVFDLKSKREVRQVVVVPGPGHIFPNQLKVLTSVDGDTYQLAATLKLDGSRQEIQTPLFSAQAQFVKLEIAWPQAGAALDEIEIFGR